MYDQLLAQIIHPEHQETSKLTTIIAEKNQEIGVLRERLASYELNIKEFEEFVNKLWSGASILGETDFSVEALKNLTLQANEILEKVMEKI